MKKFWYVENFSGFKLPLTKTSRYHGIQEAFSCLKNNLDYMQN